MVENHEIKASGFEHWILGSADLAEPLAMPTHLPYNFSAPDEQGRVPFPDVVLASGYSWANAPENSQVTGIEPGHFSGEEAVELCMLRPYIYAVYGAQPFIEESQTAGINGLVNTGRWREATAQFLLRESGLQVNWLGDAPRIKASKDFSENGPVIGGWQLRGIDLNNDRRASQPVNTRQTAHPLGLTGQTSALPLPRDVLFLMRTPAWKRRLLLIG